MCFSLKRGQIDPYVKDSSKLCTRRLQLFKPPHGNKPLRRLCYALEQNERPSPRWGAGAAVFGEEARLP